MADPDPYLQLAISSYNWPKNLEKVEISIRKETNEKKVFEQKGGTPRLVAPANTKGIKIVQPTNKNSLQQGLYLLLEHCPPRPSWIADRR